MRVKLIRDRGPISVGEARPANTLAGKHLALVAKLNEEVDEIARDATNVEEYADLLEALRELAFINGVMFEDIEAARVEKRERLGGFNRGMVWSVDVPTRASWPP